MYGDHIFYTGISIKLFVYNSSEFVYLLLSSLLLLMSWGTRSVIISNLVKGLQQLSQS